MADLKLFMLMLGCTPPGRHIEQHDIFFGIAPALHDLVPQIKTFWPEPEKIHIDAWREVNTVEGYRVKVLPKTQQAEDGPKLFFINLGGYLEGKFEEQHYVLLTVQPDRASAFSTAKKTMFYKTNHFDDANSHIDDKYGIDVDELYEIEDILSPEQKQRYSIVLSAEEGLAEDPIHLGYLKLSVLENKD